MKRQFTYQVVLTVKLEGETGTRHVKPVKVRASDEQRAINCLKEHVERQMGKRVAEVVFSEVTYA